VSPLDVNGIYEAIVEIKWPDGQWTAKKMSAGSKTMFPKDWSREKNF
jgi:hypothetical protein